MGCFLSAELLLKRLFITDWLSNVVRVCFPVAELWFHWGWISNLFPAQGDNPTSFKSIQKFRGLLEFTTNYQSTCFSSFLQAIHWGYGNLLHFNSSWSAFHSSSPWKLMAASHLSQLPSSQKKNLEWGSHVKSGLHSQWIIHKVCKTQLQKSVLVAEHQRVYGFLRVHTEIGFPEWKKRSGEPWSEDKIHFETESEVNDNFAMPEMLEKGIHWTQEFIS